MLHCVPNLRSHGRWWLAGARGKTLGAPQRAPRGVLLQLERGRQIFNWLQWTARYGCSPWLPHVIVMIRRRRRRRAQKKKRHDTTRGRQGQDSTSTAALRRTSPEHVGMEMNLRTRKVSPEVPGETAEKSHSAVTKVSSGMREPRILLHPL